MKKHYNSLSYRICGVWSVWNIIHAAAFQCDQKRELEDLKKAFPVAVIFWLLNTLETHAKLTEENNSVLQLYKGKQICCSIIFHQHKPDPPDNKTQKVVQDLNNNVTYHEQWFIYN